MGILKGAITYHSDIHSNYVGISSPVITHNIRKTLWQQSRGWGYKHKCQSILQVDIQFGGISLQPRGKKQWCAHCSFNSSSDGNGNMAGNFNANDEDYVNSTVIEAVQVRSGSEGFIIKMRDGRCLRCIHNNPHGGKLSEYAPHPAIVLKMEDGSDLLLPIIVLEMPSVLLMAAIRNVPIARPTIYQVAKMMMEELGWKLWMLNMLSDQPILIMAVVSFCFFGIMWGMRLRFIALTCDLLMPSIWLFNARPDGQPCIETEEFGLMRSMLTAVIEERYKDAALWRDQLLQFRKKMNWT